MSASYWLVSGTPYIANMNGHVDLPEHVTESQLVYTGFMIKRNQTFRTYETKIASVHC